MGEGIRVVERAELAAALERQPNNLTMVIVQPYLADPLLRRGRKWDVRTYVLVTSVLPVRAYLFTEAIVRYASTAYSAASRDDVPCRARARTPIRKPFRGRHRERALSQYWAPPRS
eukprot:1908205-Prymnesium_polylepis.1